MTSPHLEIVPRKNIPVVDWDAAADAFPAAWYWHRSGAIDAYATWQGSTDCSFAIVDRASGGQISAILPLRGIRRNRLLMRLESTGGLATAPDLAPRQLRSVRSAARGHLLALARRTGAYRVDLSLPPLAPACLEDQTGGVNPLALLGCQEMSTQSWIVDLRDATVDDLWRNLEHRVRKSVNRARGAGIYIREATPADFTAYCALHAENCRRTGISEKPAAYFRSIFDAHEKRDGALIVVAMDASGAVIAVHTFAIYKGAALYWTTASGSAALESGANDLLQWEAMQRFLALGIHFYETGEAFPAQTAGKLRSISDFKKGFGGRLRPYFRGSIVTRPVLSALLDLLRALRDMSSTGER